MLSRVPRNTLRGFALRQTRPRFQSSSTATLPKPNNSALYGGLVGGGVVLAGTLAWYHLSGTRDVVKTAKATMTTVRQTKEKLQESVPSPAAALAFLRFAAKTFAPFPGVDRVFDELDKTADKHGDRISAIMASLSRDITDAYQKGDSKQLGDRVIKAFQRSMEEIHSLASDVSSDIFGPMLDKSPELKRVLGTSYDQLKSNAEKYGPEARRIATDAANRAANILNQGINSSTLNDAAILFQEKTREIQELASKSSSDAWETAKNSAQPMMDRLPDLKKVLDDNVESLKGYVGEERVNIVKDLYRQLEEISKSGKPPKQMKEEAEKVVKDKIDKLRNQGGVPIPDVDNFDLSELGVDKLKSIPGLGGIVDHIPKLRELQEIAEKRGPEAKKLLDKTYEDIKTVLDSKIEEAKKIGSEVKQDAKKQTQKNQ